MMNIFRIYPVFLFAISCRCRVIGTLKSGFQTQSMSAIPLITIYLCGMTGCNSLDTDYAVSRGKSINGIQVFTDELRKHELKVDVWPGLVNQLYSDYEVAIIFINDFDQPDADALDMLVEMQEFSDFSKIIFVHRDLDLTESYWDDVHQQLLAKEPDQAQLAKQLSQEAATELKWKLAASYEPLQDELLAGVKINPQMKKLTTETLLVHSINDRATGNKNTKLKCRMHNYRVMQPPPGHQVLWKTEAGDPILTVNQLDLCSIYNLQTAYPLLNGAQIHAENRQLVDELIKIIEPADKIALVTRCKLMNISDDENTWRFMQVFPHPWIISHLVLMMTLFCLYKMPIFGRPLITENNDLKSFGTHVEALGDLLRKTNRKNYALNLLNAWKKRSSHHRKLRKHHDQ